MWTHQVPIVLSVLAALVPTLASAQQGDMGPANEHMHQRPFEELVESFESPERDAWQRPDAVLAKLGDLSGLTAMDLGSGTGYFAFRLLEAGAHVICADVDIRFLGYTRGKMLMIRADPSRMEFRHLPYDSPLLAPGEVDLVLTVDTFHHIQNRPAYFAEVLQGLAPGGRLVVIDFFPDAPEGPPADMKLEPEQVVAELREAGFRSFETDLELLPYQYIVTARP